MPSHPGLTSGVQTMYEPSGHPHGASAASTTIGNTFAGGPGSFTPPGSARRLGSPMDGGPFFMQHQQLTQPQQQMYGHASPDMDDASSVGSGEGHLGNMSRGSGGVSGSPGRFESGLGNVYGGNTQALVTNAPAPTRTGRKPSLSLSMPSHA